MRPCSPEHSSACSLGKGRFVPAGRKAPPYVVHILLLLLLLIPATAHADFLVIPFVGLKIAGHTNLVDLEQGAGEKKATFGASAAALSDGLLGVSADVEHTPHFFERAARGGLVRQSSVTTVMGNVIVAVPLRITQESLRPFVVGGVGLMHANVQDVLGLFNTSSNLVGMNIGGGAIGFVSPRVGARFELRHFKNLSQDNRAVTFGTTRLSYWRLTAGLVLRY